MRSNQKKSIEIVHRNTKMKIQSSLFRLIKFENFSINKKKKIMSSRNSLAMQIQLFLTDVLLLQFYVFQRNFCLV